MVRAMRAVLDKVTLRARRAVRVVTYHPKALMFATLILASAVAYPVEVYLQQQRYSLGSDVEALVGKVNPNLANKLKLNEETAVYEFNGGVVKEQAPGSQTDPTAVLESMKQNTGGGGAASRNLYALDVPLDPKKGVSYYDKNLKLSFTATPQFDLSSGRADDNGRLVFPASQGIKAVYSLKTNGLKEDMVLTRPVGNMFSFSYKLNLPKELEARLEGDGSIGIYSADPVLFGNVSYGSDADYEKLQSARESAPKNNLVFALPAPVIVQQGNKAHHATSRFVLDGDILTVESTGLEQLTYPISIDPSVVVTSSADFLTGNNEGSIDYATDQIQRGSLTGGSITSWATEANAIPVNREYAATGVYNGRIYVMGGYNNSTASELNSVIYSTINADGTLGAWTTSSSAFTNARYYHAGDVYNGYLYIMGGRNTAGTRFNDVQYAKINIDGTVGPWSTGTSFTSGRSALAGLAHGGYLYILGGFDGTTYFNDVQYSALNATGGNGTWSTTAGFTGGRYGAATVDGVDYIYLAGGVLSTGATTSEVQVAKFNPDGTLGAWRFTTALPNANYVTKMAYHKGYLYWLGGESTTSSPTTHYYQAYYAQVNSDGQIGSWVASTNTVELHALAAVVAYGDYIYQVGGEGATAPLTAVVRAKINPAGLNDGASTTTAIPTVRVAGKNYGRYGHTTVVKDNYIYIIGGYANAAIATVYSASLSTDGTIGAWSATTSLPAARYYHSSVVYGGYLYVIGGYTTAHQNDILYTTINGGTLGTWSTNATTFTNARSSMGAVVSQDKLYIMGGYGTSFVEYNDVQYATFGASGAIGSFSTSTAFANARDSLYVAVIGKYLYVVGGWNGTTTYGDVQFAEINPSGGLVGGLSSCPGGGTLTGGTWCSTTSLQTARRGFTGYVSKGCLYVSGGGIAGNSVTATVEYACVNADGTLAAWNYGTQPTTVQRDYASGAVYRDVMYLIGGEAGGPAFSDVFYAPINNGGSGDVRAYSSTTSFTTARVDNAAVVYNGYLYILGGSNNSTTYYNDVQYAPINADGTLGAWQTTTSFSTARAKHTTVVSNGYMYIMGGCTGTATAIASSQYAPINANGTLGSWTNTQALPQASCEQAAATYNGYVYSMGGTDFSTTTAAAYRSAINSSTGALGAWSAVNSLINARASGPGAVAYNGYLYLAGGTTPAATERSVNVEYAKINADGTLGAWRYTAQLPDRREFPGIAVSNGVIYLTGGNTGGGNVATSYFAPIAANDGSLDSWSMSSSSFNGSRLRHRSVFYDGYLYIIAGYSAGLLNDVQFAPVVSIPRKAAYSRLIDLGSLVTVNSVTYTGSGDTSLSFRTAGTNGVFGGSMAAGSAGGASARYVWVKGTVNDITGAAFTDSLSRISTITDITVDYTASGGPTCTTAQRLRHGAAFSSQALQALDSCIQL